jgi:hypothetical protein
MKYLRYYSEFRSIKGVAWRVEILQEAASAYSAERIRLSGDSPLAIEWNEVDKIDTIQTSKATLTLASDSDRKFIDLYSVEAGAIRLAVYRGDVLYWAGTLDTELYEEPYSYRDNYDVRITFSDFAILDRLKWDMTGLHTIGEVINHLLAKTQRNSIAQVHYISTTTVSGASVFQHVQINADNFYDDDGAADSCRDALEAILQPFAMRMVQRMGEVYFYDLNRLYSEVPVPVVWKGDDAVLAADKVYSDIVISLDPNFKNTLVEAKITNLEPTNSYDYLLNYVPITGRNGETYDGYDGFTFEYGGEADSDYILYDNLKYFKVTPKFSGENDTGIVFSFCHLPLHTRDAQYIRYLSNINMYSQNTDNYSWGGYLFELKQRPLIIRNPGDMGYINIKLKLAFDARYNPYEPKSGNNEPANYDRYDRIKTFYLPVVIELLDDNDNVLYHYSNANIYWNSFGLNPPESPFGFGKWVAGAHPVINGASEQGVRDTVRSYLCFYKNITSEDGGASLLWASNKPMRGSMAYYGDIGMPAIFNKFNDGEFIKFPPTSGRLRIRVVRGFELLITGSTWPLTKVDYMLLLQSVNRWLLFKDLSVSVVDRYGRDKDNDNEEDGENTDVRETINAAAKEECQIDTRVGTLAMSSPTALGQLFDLNRQIIKQFKRAGEISRLEKLLVNTIKANYSSRTNILSGTAELLPDFRILSEQNTAGKFLLIGDVQRPHEDTSEIKIVRFMQDTPPVYSVDYNNYVCQMELPAPPHIYTIGYDLNICQTD